MKNALVLVSHSQAITDGLKEMIEDMVAFKPDQLKIFSAGGREDGGIGTTPSRVLEAFREAGQADQIYVFTDMGSAAMSAETALSFLDEDKADKYTIFSQAPLVEGAYVAAVQISIGADKEKVISAVNRSQVG